MESPAINGQGDDPGLTSDQIAPDAPVGLPSYEEHQDATVHRNAVLEASQPILARIERGAQTRNPVGLSGKDCAILFDFIQLQTQEHVMATQILMQMGQELEEARKQHGDWKKEDSGLVVPS